MAMKVKAVERLVKFNKNDAGTYRYVLAPELYSTSGSGTEGTGTEGTGTSGSDSGDGSGDGGGSGKVGNED